MWAKDPFPEPVIATLCLVLSATSTLGASHLGDGVDVRGRLLAHLDVTGVETGILYDLVLPLSGIEQYDGRPGSPAMTRATWQQIYHELWRAALDMPAWPPLDRLLDETQRTRDMGVIPLAVLEIFPHQEQSN